MALGSNQPLTEMITRKISGACHLHVPIVLKYGRILNLLEHSGYAQACTGSVTFSYHGRLTLFVVKMRMQ
jgi:hypothetical protein